MNFDSVPRNIPCEFLLMKRALHKWELNGSSLSTGSAVYGGHSIVEKPRRNAVAARWRSSPSDKGHHCISECKQRKCRRLSPKSPDLNIIEIIWDELNRRVRRTGAIPTILRAKYLYEWNNLPQNYVRRYLTSMRRQTVFKGNNLRHSIDVLNT